MGVARVTWPNFLISGPPNNFWRNRDIRLKFGTNIEDAPLRRANHKMTPKWAWPISRDRISKFWDHSYNFWTNRDIGFKFGTYINHGPLLRPNNKTTQSGRGLGHVTKCRNFGTHLITFEGMEIPDSYLAQTHRHRERTPTAFRP